MVVRRSEEKGEKRQRDLLACFLPAEEVAFKMRSEDEKELARSQRMERSEFRLKGRTGLIII